ncbi:MAG: tetratricopeptide repeat protein [Clostridiales bacterium]|nr:tetratricopeptide repeat protein [Clostridiales bacterium]
MSCPNCGSSISDKRMRCDRCGLDLTIYRKIVHASNQYYNIGLAKAKVRDLSGAIVALRNSLQLNKLHTHARNLLGLIYFEMGETVAALSEWVISKHFQPDDNDAEEYINRVQSNLTKLDVQNQAIKRYNTALNFAKQGSDDLAIIQLKKVVSLNPHFIRAYHLLSLLYMKNDDNDEARRTLLKASKIDVSNNTTLRYMKELNVPVATRASDNSYEAETSPTSSIVPVSSYKEDKPNIMAFVNLVIGVVIGLAVTTFLIVPSIEKRQNMDDNSNYVDYSSGLALQEEKEKIIKDLQEKNTELQGQVSDLQAEIDRYADTEDVQAMYDPLFVAVQYYLDEMAKAKKKDRDIMGIAEKLAAVDESELESEDSVALLTRLREEIYPTAAKEHYDIGHDMYSDAKYEESLTEFMKSMNYDPTDVNPVYFSARAYHRLGDYENAAIYYSIVLSDFPDSKREKNAKSFLNQVREAEE